MNHGEMMSITILNKGRVVLTIKDSMRILPSSLASLARDWQVETQKDHFPHYFNPLELYGTLDWSGPIPAYEYFEPKRTSIGDYDAMVLEFQGKIWSFLEVSQSYIMSDVKALYQILRSFFETLASKFPIDPLTALSAPSIAFKIWRTVQLPVIKQRRLKSV